MLADFVCLLQAVAVAYYTDTNRIIGNRKLDKGTIKHAVYKRFSKIRI